MKGLYATAVEMLVRSQYAMMAPSANSPTINHRFGSVDCGLAADASLIDRLSLLRFPVHERKTLAGTRLGAVAGHVLHQLHLAAQLLHGPQDGHIELHFRAAGLVGPVVNADQVFKIVVGEIPEDSLIQLLVADD